MFVTMKKIITIIKVIIIIIVMVGQELMVEIVS